MYVRMYVSVTLRNVAVTSRRNVTSMMRIRTPSYINICMYVNSPLIHVHTLVIYIYMPIYIAGMWTDEVSKCAVTSARKYFS